MPVGRFDSDMSTELVKNHRYFTESLALPSTAAEDPTVHDRHHQIEQDERRGRRQCGEKPQRFQPVAGADGREPGIIEKLAEGVPDRVIVVDHENQRAFRFHERGRFGAFGVTHDAPSASSPAIDTATERLSWMRLGDDIP